MHALMLHTTNTDTTTAFLDVFIPYLRCVVALGCKVHGRHHILLRLVSLHSFPPKKMEKIKHVEYQSIPEQVEPLFPVVAEQVT